MTAYTINGTSYPIAFNFNTIRHFMKGAGLVKINDFDKLMMDKPADETTISDLENRIGLIYEGIKEGCRIEKQTFDLSIDDLFAEITENPDMLTDIINEFIEAQPPADAGKKKVKAPKK